MTEEDILRLRDTAEQTRVQFKERVTRDNQVISEVGNMVTNGKLHQETHQETHQEEFPKARLTKDQLDIVNFCSVPSGKAERV